MGMAEHVFCSEANRSKPNPVGRSMTGPSYLVILVPAQPLDHLARRGLENELQRLHVRISASSYQGAGSHHARELVFQGHGQVGRANMDVRTCMFTPLCCPRRSRMSRSVSASPFPLISFSSASTRSVGGFTVGIVCRLVARLLSRSIHRQQEDEEQDRPDSSAV